MVDEGTIRSFITMLHDAAARALKGASDPGVLQIVRIHPNGGTPVTTRFPIGAVDLMVEDAIKAASGGLNAYTEGRTVEARASGRGTAGATRAVFALIDDSDGDKGKAGTLPAKPTWAVESSPGNRHNWFVLDRALTSDEARPIGAAMRKAIGSDSATGKPEQPFRIPGTPNYPGPAKRERGRVTTPTRILSTEGPTWSAANLVEVFPPLPEHEAASVPGGRSGATSDTVEELAAATGPDRSERFFAAVVSAFRASLLPADLEDVFRRYPEGCASKYLLPYDRLAVEIARAWEKVGATAAQETAATPDVGATYPDRAVPVDEARVAVRDALEAHFAAGAGQRAIRVSTGVGKTVAAVTAVVADIRRRRARGDKTATLYLAPTLALADEVAALFRGHGVEAQVFRGRGADDPASPGAKMCQDLEAVGLALKLDLAVGKACCKLKEPVTGRVHTCKFHETCAYQRQTGRRPDVWLASHEMLWTAPSGLGEIGSLVVDEGFAQGGARIAKRGTTLDEVGAEPGIGTTAREILARADVAAWRSRLQKALRRQETIGGLARRHLVEGGLDAATCAKASALEWRLVDKVSFWPGMDRQARMDAAEAAAVKGKVGKVAAVWRAARELLEQEDTNAVSGRLVLSDVETEDGSGKARVVLTHSLKRVLKRWLKIPVVLLDATLPPVEVLQRFFPEIEITADIEAKAAHATVRQVLGAPVSAGKLLKSEAGRNRDAVRRAVLHRYVELGRPSTLVVAQKAMAEWLRASRLPATIKIAHYGALAGLDGFKDVGLLIAIGRTMPDVFEVETLAGAMTGLEPLRTAAPAKGARFHDRVALALRMSDGTARPVQGYRHPDPIGEAARWQVAEAGVLQAIGRARAVNRTSADPVVIEVWNDLALPVTVNEAVVWDAVPTGREIEMLTDGIVLESAPDMATCWPKVWETAEAARVWRKRTTEGQTPIREPSYKGLTLCGARYQRPGERQKWRSFRFDPAVCPDPRAWLEARLGPLAGFTTVFGA